MLGCVIVREGQARPLPKLQEVRTRGQEDKGPQVSSMV